MKTDGWGGPELDASTGPTVQFGDDTPQMVFSTGIETLPSLSPRHWMDELSRWSQFDYKLTYIFWKDGDTTVMTRHFEYQNLNAVFQEIKTK